MTTETINKMAGAILEMTYDELMSVASLLCTMNGDIPRDLNDEREWAEILNSWANGAIKEEPSHD